MEKREERMNGSIGQSSMVLWKAARGVKEGKTKRSPLFTRAKKNLCTKPKNRSNQVWIHAHPLLLSLLPPSLFYCA